MSLVQHRYIVSDIQKPSETDQAHHPVCPHDASGQPIDARCLRYFISSAAGAHTHASNTALWALGSRVPHRRAVEITKSSRREPEWLTRWEHASDTSRDGRLMNTGESLCDIRCYHMHDVVSASDDLLEERDHRQS
jgi:hypothetical protein